MDETRFDRFARLLAEGRGRRDVFRLLAGAGAALGVSPALARQDGTENPEETAPDDAGADDATPDDAAPEGPDAGRATGGAPGAAARCGQKRDTCRRDSQCCSGLICVNDRCKKDRNGGGGGSCKDDGRKCTRNKDCCSGLICNDDGRCGTKTQVKFERAWGTSGTGNSQFRSPEGVGIDAGTSGGDIVYVADTGNDRIQKFNASGSYQSKWGSNGGGASQFRSPAGVGVNENDGYVYVADRQNTRISVFSETGSAVQQFGSTRSWTPSDVAVLSGNTNNVKVFVADTENNRIGMLRGRPLSFVTNFGTIGSGDGQLRSPRGVAVSTNYTVVADTQNNRIQVFRTNSGDSAPTFLRSFGKNGSRDGQFRGPRGVALDNQNRIWVADTGNNRIQVFDINGDFQFKIGGTASGTANGKFDNPYGIAVVGSKRDGYRIYVADTFNNRIQKFTMPGRR